MKYKFSVLFTLELIGYFIPNIMVLGYLVSKVELQKLYDQRCLSVVTELSLSVQHEISVLLIHSLARSHACVIIRRC